MGQRDRRAPGSWEGSAAQRRPDPGRGGGNGGGLCVSAAALGTLAAQMRCSPPAVAPGGGTCLSDTGPRGLFGFSLHGTGLLLASLLFQNTQGVVGAADTCGRALTSGFPAPLPTHLRFSYLTYCSYFSETHKIDFFRDFYLSLPVSSRDMLF